MYLLSLAGTKLTTLLRCCRSRHLLWASKHNKDTSVLAAFGAAMRTATARVKKERATLPDSNRPTREDLRNSFLVLMVRVHVIFMSE